MLLSTAVVFQVFTLNLSQVDRKKPTLVILRSPPPSNIKCISIIEINTVSMPDGTQMVIKMQDTVNGELNE